MLQLVEKISVDSIVEKVKNGKFVSKDEVLRNWRETGEDDIVVGSSTISLKDPLGYTRIKIPCKSTRCSHIQCFDAYLFFQLNEQVPTWTCPVCNLSIGSWEDIVVDGYFSDILKNTPQDQETVSIDPNGIWTIPKKRVIDEPKFSMSKLISKKPRIDQPPQDVYIIDSSDEEKPLKKKQLSQTFDCKEIIDLTISSDEEEEPSKTFKDIATGTTIVNFPVKIEKKQEIPPQPISLNMPYSTPNYQSSSSHFNNYPVPHYYHPHQYEIPVVDAKSSIYYDNSESTLINTPGSLGESYEYYMSHDRHDYEGFV
ncbi:15823_t:CDS:2 [Acaulospora colombiana]|uniref:15823_t:CDS:1 n=1 Tax=Acaulospora colombiana TaxID=27376 RepID=A0ACA9KDL2_9GLOM|nr:15823_t:CDS:2 [Acaulospora colombiana]